METNTPGTITITKKFAIESAIRRRGKEFFWIAGLSAINSIAMYLKSKFILAVGLGITQFFDYALIHGNNFARVIGALGDLVILGFFVLLGYKAIQLKRWAFVVGFILYLCDTLLFIFAKDAIGIAIHLLFLFGILQGIKLFTHLRKADEEEKNPTLPQGVDPTLAITRKTTSRQSAALLFIIVLTLVFIGIVFH